MSAQSLGETPDVDKNYYAEGVRWETAVYRSVVWSRNIWRTVSVLLGLALILALAALYALIPSNRWRW
jgi:type IV secretion system protein VirB8